MKFQEDHVDLTDQEIMSLLEEPETVVEKVLTVQQRLKRSRIMRRLKPKLQRIRDIKKKRMADPAKLMYRARKMAIANLRKRFAGKMGADYANLSASQKVTVDRLIEKKRPLVVRIAKRLLPRVRKLELERLRRVRGSVKESVQYDDPDRIYDLNKVAAGLMPRDEYKKKYRTSRVRGVITRVRPKREGQDQEKA